MVHLIIPLCLNAIDLTVYDKEHVLPQYYDYDIKHTINE